MSDSGICNPSPFRGTTNGVATSPLPESLPKLINNFRIVNKTAGAISMNVYLIGGGTDVCIAPNNYQLSANAIYQQTEPIVQLVTEQIKVQVSGQVDYDFTISNIEIK